MITVEIREIPAGEENEPRTQVNVTYEGQQFTLYFIPTGPTTFDVEVDTPAETRVEETYYRIKK